MKTDSNVGRVPPPGADSNVGRVPPPGEASPLVTKSEHLAGRKTLNLFYRWGEPVAVELRPLGWRELQLLATSAEEKNLSSADHSALLVKASIHKSDPSYKSDRSEPLLDLLDAPSASLLQRTALAFSLGEKAIKNAVAGQSPTAPPSPTPTPSSHAGSAK